MVIIIYRDRAFEAQMDTTAAADNQIEPGSTSAVETTALLTIESLKVSGNNIPIVYLCVCV